jgi:small-conductance mechanosensitive channel
MFIHSLFKQGARAVGFILLAFLLVAGGQVSAQPAVPTGTASPASSAPENEIKDKQAALAGEIHAVSQALNAVSATGTSEYRDVLTQQIAALRRIELFFGQQAAALQSRQSLAAAKSQTETEIAKVQGAPPEKATFLDLDNLRDTLTAEEDREKSIDARVESRQSALAKARTAYEDAETIRRRAKERLETSQEEADRPLLAHQLKVAEMESRSATETIRLRDLELGNESLERETFRLRLAGLRARVKALQESALFTAEELNQKLDALHKREAALGLRRETAEAAAAVAKSRLEKVIEKLGDSANPEPALREEVEARKKDREFRQREVLALGDQLQRLSDQRELWQRRFKAVHGKAEPKDLRTWVDEAKAIQAKMDSLYGSQSSLLDDRRRELRGFASRIAENKDAGSARWIEDQRRSLQNLIQLEEEDTQSLEETLRLAGRFIAEIEDQTASWSWREWWEGIQYAVSSVWYYEIAESEDHSIYFGRIVIALTLLGIGTWAARRASCLLGRRVLSRLRMAQGAASTLQSLAYYLLLILFIYFALKVASIPLTLFAFVGGALAIGIGFGSQNIINNFISGLILLIERPILEGDQIEYSSGNIGTVVRIGARCTHVRTGSNVDIFIPNSSLLQSNIINWTRNDDKVRVQIHVPVAYSTQPREAARLLRKAAEEHGKILKKPEPVVMLRNFGENALEFQLQFWIQMTPGTDRCVVESDVRFMIDNHFREAGIMMPFVQRDLHLDSKGPLDIRLLPAGEESSDEG